MEDKTLNYKLNSDDLQKLAMIAGFLIGVSGFLDEGRDKYAKDYGDYLNYLVKRLIDES